MFYRLVFKHKSKYASFLKIMLLIVGLLCDIVAVFGLVLAILGALLYLLLFFGSLVLSIITRVCALKLVYDIECKLQNGKLIISKIYPNKRVVVLDEMLSDIKVNEFNEQMDLIDKKDKIINLLISPNERYLVRSKNTTILCNLDKYIYACILKGEEI